VDTASFQLAESEGRIDVNLMFSKVIDTDLESLRYSQDGSKFTLKCANAADISYLEARAIEESIGFTTYNYTEILAELAKEEWQPPPDPLP